MKWPLHIATSATISSLIILNTIVKLKGSTLCLVLSHQQSKTQRWSVYTDIKQRETAPIVWHFCFKNDKQQINYQNSCRLTFLQLTRRLINSLFVAALRYRNTHLIWLRLLLVSFSGAFFHRTRTGFGPIVPTLKLFYEGIILLPAWTGDHSDELFFQ